MELRGSEPVQARALSDSLDALGSTELGKERVERVAAAKLPAFSAQEPEPLAVVDGAAISAPPENLDGDLAQSPPSQLAIQALETHLWPPVRELLDFTQEPLVDGELLFELLDDCPMRLHTTFRLRQAIDERASLTLKDGVAARDEIVHRGDPTHGDETTKQVGRAVDTSDLRGTHGCARAPSGLQRSEPALIVGVDVYVVTVNAGADDPHRPTSTPGRQDRTS